MLSNGKPTSRIIMTRGLATTAMLSLLSLLAPQACIAEPESTDIPGDEPVSTAQGALGTRQNLALGKPATQSSNYPNSYNPIAAKAVDGNTDGNFAGASVTHTNYDSQAWWQVDLLASQPVGEVILYNRTDCCGGRLSNFNLLVSDDGASWQAYPFAGAAPAQVSFAVNRTARYVKVQLQGTDHLSLAEVQVLTPSANLALGRPATQSSNYPNSYNPIAAKAVDGNANGDFAGASVTHTNYDSHAWWQVDLQSVQPVGDVFLYNRTDCCGGRLSNFNLKVSSDGANWQSFPYPGSAPARVSFSVNRPARYVKVELEGADNLSLAEVQVFERTCPAGQTLLDGLTCVTLTPWNGGDLPAGARIAMRAGTRFKNDGCSGCTGVEAFGPAWVKPRPYQFNSAVPVYDYLEASSPTLTSDAVFTITAIPRAQNEYLSGNNPSSYQKLLLQSSSGKYVNLDSGSELIANTTALDDAPIWILDRTHGTSAGLSWIGYRYSMNASLASNHPTTYGTHFAAINGMTLYQTRSAGFSPASYFELFIVP